MGVKLLLLYVIYQMFITTSLGVSLPFSDFIGKVTPVQPKSLNPSTFSPLCASKQSLVIKPPSVWDGDDRPKLSSPAAGVNKSCRDFSSPIVLTSTTRPLPVPKMDPSSISNLKLPERFSKKLLPPKVKSIPAIQKICDAPILKNSSPDIRMPEISLPYQNPYLSSPKKLTNVFPNYSSPDMYFSSLNKLLSLPSIKSLPIVPMEALKRNYIDSFPETNNLLVSSTPNKFSRPTPSTSFSSVASTLDLPLILETKNPTVMAPEPYPLFYKSIYLPRVTTPADMLSLNYKPASYIGAGNLNFPIQTNTQNILSPKLICPSTCPDSSYGKNKPSVYTALPKSEPEFMSPCVNSIKPEISNSVKIPKIPTMPFSFEVSSPYTQVKNAWDLLKSSSCTASDKLETPQYLTPLFDSSSCKNPAPLLNSNPYKFADLKPDCMPLDATSTVMPKIPFVSPATCTTCVPPVLPSNFLGIPILPPQCISPPNLQVNPCNLNPISFDVDILPNCINNIKINTDCSRTINIPNILPIVDACVETIGRINSDDLSRDLQSYVDYENEPYFWRISPIIPEINSCQLPSWLKHTNPLLSPKIDCPETPTTPVSYINTSPSSPISQSSSNMVSSINELVSNIAQNIVSSYKTYLKSAPKNVSVRPKQNPFIDAEYKPDQTLSVQQPLPPVNLVNTISALPVLSSPIDFISPCTVDSPILLTLDAPIPYTSSTQKAFPNFLSPTYSSQPITASKLPSTSLINYSSPQICPTYLPSPILPSYPVMSSPFYMEPPVLEVGSSNKSGKDMEKLLELMCIIELLNNDESFDWDDLDTLLAFLAIK